MIGVLTRTDESQNGQGVTTIMRRFLLVCLAFLAGLVGGYALAILGYIVWSSMPGSFDRDGGGAMFVAFAIGPVVALLSGIGAAIVTAVRLARRPAAKG